MRDEKRSPEWRDGFEAGVREAREEGWTLAMLRDYLARVGPPPAAFAEFDAGHVAGLRSVAEKRGVRS